MWAYFRQEGEVEKLSVCDIAMTIVVDNQGHVLARSNTMLDSERVVGEQVLGALIRAVGLYLRATQRVGFDGGDAPEWDNQGKRIA